MKPSDLSNHISQWFDGSGPGADIVISSRVRLARNLGGYEFCPCLNASRKREVLNKLKEIILSLDLGQDMFFIDVDNSSTLEQDLLVERHLISRQHAQAKGPRGAIIAQNESFTAMINEEDHLRIQVFKTGLQLKECWERINQVDNLIEKQVEYAFDPEYGYLTACPTNVGTGIRVSVMLHLPALKMTGQIEKFYNAAKDTNLAVRGLFGEGTDAVGDFFQLSNQVTLGYSEQQIVDEFSGFIVPKIVEYEILAREKLLKAKPDMLDDKIQRALGVLRSARLISSQEALFLLSHVRMGVNLKRLEGISIATINELFMLTQPAHLQMRQGHELDPDRRDAMRAQIIRSRLCQN
ncbi:MAG: protein arginine kinase [Sedimentisphaerales bacterium]|nr:protein arginine kinase [Sedimentisphaerales bacterium]